MSEDIERLSNVDMNKNDHYEVLGVPMSAQPEDIKKAYHRKLLECHPDKSEALQKTSEEFLVIKAAWEVLSDPKLRREYDIKRRQEILDSDHLVVHARVNPSELDKTDDDDYYSYPCRCGYEYLVHKTDLESSQVNMYVTCQDCTFVLIIET